MPLCQPISKMSTSADHRNHSPSRHSACSADPEILTPTTTVVEDLDYREEHADRPPIPGKTYLIRCLTDGCQITLLGGQVVMAEPRSLGSPYWHCIENNGWLGFRNAATNLFLGHDGRRPGDLVCVAERHRLWEWFQVDQHRLMTAGYALRIEYYGGLRPVGTRLDSGTEKLERVQDESKHGLVWSFIEVS